LLATSWSAANFYTIFYHHHQPINIIMFLIQFLAICLVCQWCFRIHILYYYYSPLIIQFTTVIIIIIRPLPSTARHWTSPIVRHLARSSALTSSSSQTSCANRHSTWPEGVLHYIYRESASNPRLTQRLTVVRLIWPAHSYFSMLIRCAMCGIDDEKSRRSFPNAAQPS
jgi:hypothetical protein